MWLIANVVGSMFLPAFVWQEAYDLRSRIFLTEILQGIGISITQSLVLRDRFAKHGWWLPLTVFGWSAGLVLIFFVPLLSVRSQSPDLVSATSSVSIVILLIDFAIIGTTVGVCQWQLLKSFRAAGLWLFVSAIALSVSTFGVYLGYIAKSTVLGSALQGAIYGAITGLAAIKVLRSPKVLPKSKR